MTDLANRNSQNGNSNGHNHYSGSHQQLQEGSAYIQYPENKAVQSTPSLDALQAGDRLNQKAKLLFHFIREVQTSGECPLPEMEDLVNDVYELREVMPRVVIPTQIVDHLVDRLKTNFDQINTRSVYLHQYISQVISCLEHNSQLDTSYLLQVNCDINQILLDLSHAVSCILDVNHQVNQMLKTYDGDDVELSDDKLLQVKLKADLKYFQAYFVKQGHSNSPRLQRIQISYLELQFERLLSYVLQLPVACKFLVNQTKRDLEMAVPGFPLSTRPPV